MFRCSRHYQRAQERETLGEHIMRIWINYKMQGNNIIALAWYNDDDNFSLLTLISYEDIMMMMMMMTRYMIYDLIISDIWSYHIWCMIRSYMMYDTMMRWRDGSTSTLFLQSLLVSPTSTAAKWELTDLKTRFFLIFFFTGIIMTTVRGWGV